MESYLHKSVILRNSDYGVIKAFRNVNIIDSTIGDFCSIGDDTTLVRVNLEGHVAINRRSYINDSCLGAYSYTGINTIINYTKIGRFCSIGRNVDIGGFNHDYHKITTMPADRFMQMNGDEHPYNRKETTELCQIGNDVWIAAGAQILHNVKIGDGAVVGGGAVVTHDVPPYAIVVGVPAKIRGFRCEKQMIDRLLEIKWWDWPERDIINNHQLLIHHNISFETIDKLQMISTEIKQRISDDNE